jgi:hypothetical protein
VEEAWDLCTPHGAASRLPLLGAHLLRERLVAQVTDLTRQGEEEQVAPEESGYTEEQAAAKRMRLKRKGRKRPPRSNRRKRRRTSTPRR